MKIVILEDDADRQAVMRRCLADRFYTFEAHFFDAAADMIRYLDANLSETIAVALDNDLELKPGPDGRCVDPGSGCQVAEFLAGREPVCPVVVHTTNTDAAATILKTLKAAGWKTRRVVPFDDTAWIETDWFFALRRAVVGPVRRTPTESRP